MKKAIRLLEEGTFIIIDLIRSEYPFAPFSKHLVYDALHAAPAPIEHPGDPHWHTTSPRNMPDINPADLSRPDPITTAVPASLSLSKANGTSPLVTTKSAKAVNTVQRIDLEPLYTGLKSAIGDNWGKYKDAISLFILGTVVGRKTPSQIFFKQSMAANMKAPSLQVH